MNNLSSENGHNRSMVYILDFLFTIHIVIPVYISSTFLLQFLKEGLVGTVYIIGSLVTIGALILVPKILRRRGNYKIAMTFLIVDLLSLIGLVLFNDNVYLVIPLFIINIVSIALVDLNFDVFLESVSNNNETGSIRGWYLTIASLAWVIGPAIAGLVFIEGQFERVYLAAAIFLIPLIYFLKKHFQNFKDPEYPKIEFLKDAKAVFKSKDLSGAFISMLLLQVFFAWMTIYSPIYLHQYVGFSIKEITLMFSIMLVSYLITQEPIGQLADRRYGEKEILIIGFIIASISSLIIPFLQTESFIIWAIVLFVSRIGASFIQTMTEIYFFKKIDGDRLDDISAFRMMRPIAYVLTAALVSAMLIFIDLRFTFIILSIIMLSGVKYVMDIKDTR